MQKFETRKGGQFASLTPEIDQGVEANMDLIAIQTGILESQRREELLQQQLASETALQNRLLARAIEMLKASNQKLESQKQKVRNYYISSVNIQEYKESA